MFCVKFNIFFSLQFCTENKTFFYKYSELLLSPTLVQKVCVCVRVKCFKRAYKLVRLNCRISALVVLRVLTAWLSLETGRHPSVKLMWMPFVILNVVLGVVGFGQSNLVWK